MCIHFTGEEQVSVGVVPIGLAAAGNRCQSALAVFPIAIANCSEKRYCMLIMFQYIIEVALHVYYTNTFFSTFFCSISYSSYQSFWLCWFVGKSRFLKSIWSFANAVCQDQVNTCTHTKKRNWHIFWQIHEVCKGMWAFFLGCALECCLIVERNSIDIEY